MSETKRSGILTIAGDYAKLLLTSSLPASSAIHLGQLLNPFVENRWVRFALR